MESNFEWITANGDIGIRFFHSIDDGGYSNPPHWHNDLEIIYLLEGRLKVRFGDGGERQTDFIDIVAWRSTAEFVSKYFTKGSMAAVVDTVLAKNANARICIAAIALESLSAAIAALTAHGLSAEVTQLAVSRTRPAGRLHPLTANNPIFLITGERK